MIRLLICFDTRGWCYESRARSLADNAPQDFAVTIAPWTERPSTEGIDVVFQLDSMMQNRLGNCPHVLSWNSDPNRRGERWQNAYESCDWLLMNNKETYLAHDRAPHTCAIANGVDTDIYRVITPIEDRIHERVFWTGSANPMKNKGFHIIREVEERFRSYGFYFHTYPVESAATKPFTTEQMVEQYNKASYVLCLSSSDSTPNTSLEGMACGACLVTTRVGNSNDFAEKPQPCVFIDRSVDGLLKGLVKARERRVEIATNGANLMREKWSYAAPGNRAKQFYWLFRELASGRVPEPFSYDEAGVHQCV